MTRNRRLAAMIELCRAEADADRAKARMDTRAWGAAQRRLQAARSAVLALGARL